MEKKYQASHKEETSKKVIEVKPEPKKHEEVVPQEKVKEVDKKEALLIFLRDNVVHGSPVNVERINKALEK